MPLSKAWLSSCIAITNPPWRLTLVRPRRFLSGQRGDLAPKVRPRLGLKAGEQVLKRKDLAVVESPHDLGGAGAEGLAGHGGVLLVNGAGVSVVVGGVRAEDGVVDGDQDGAQAVPGLVIVALGQAHQAGDLGGFV